MPYLIEYNTPRNREWRTPPGMFNPFHCDYERCKKIAQILAPHSGCIRIRDANNPAHEFWPLFLIVNP